jgi:magnesium transporter
VNPLYYVTFTTATLCASFILFSGFNTANAVNTLSLLSGFLVTFSGVYLLNLSRSDPNGSKMIGGRQLDATGTDMISSIQTRLSMQSRRSTDPHRRLSVSSQHGDREGLIRAYDEEEMAGFGLTDLAEESDESRAGHHSPRRPNGSAEANGGKYEGDAIELQERGKDDWA